MIVDSTMFKSKKYGRMYEMCKHELARPRFMWKNKQLLGRWIDVNKLKISDKLPPLLHLEQAALVPLKRCSADIRKTFSLVQSQYPRSILAVISPNLLDLSTAVIESQYMDIFNQFRLAKYNFCIKRDHSRNALFNWFHHIWPR